MREKEKNRLEVMEKHADEKLCGGERNESERERSEECNLCMLQRQREREKDRGREGKRETQKELVCNL